MNEFIPKAVQYIGRGYSLATFKKDLIAGITVGVIALPLAMAFAIASGVGPERGLYTAIIAGFLISVLGGSRVQIGGPTGAFVVIVYGIIQRTGYEGLCASMLIAAILLLLFGFFKLGSLVKHVPQPLITGFTAGIAVIIFSTQIKDFFGLQMGTPPAYFIAKWRAYFEALPTFNPLTLAVSASTLGFILVVKKFVPKIPWGITAIGVATVACLALPVDTIHSRFGSIPHTLPIPTFPSFTFSMEIFFDGVTIACLGAIESLLSCVIGDRMVDGHHRSNCELIAQGIANLGSLLFGGIPATGAIARTAANAKTGAQTPMAGIVHAITLLLVLFCLSPIVGFIPLSALSAVLIVVAWNMSEVGHFIKTPKRDWLLLLTTFLLTIFVDIMIAIIAGMALSLISKRDSEAL